MMSRTWIKAVFWLSAVYDAALGLAFLVAGNALFARFDVPPPNHPGYIQFPALLLLIFACMYARIALAPALRRELMIYGIGLKLAYCGVVFYHQVTAGIPSLWMPFAYADLVFIVLFSAAWKLTAKEAASQV